ncbi:MAG: very short patch repair endonuclease [Verrucomicrobiota bacterium]
MPDVFTIAKRSEVMSLIRSRGNKGTELRLMEVFRQQGITGWRRHVTLSFLVRDPLSPTAFLRKKVRPDFVFRKARLAVFVDGCFWHGCPEHFRRPGSRQEFWDAKIARNQARDLEVTRALRRAGWRVLRLWEHELARKREKRLVARLRRLGLGV